VRRALFLIGALGAALLLAHAAEPRAAGPCGLPDTKPVWIDFTDGTVPFGLDLFGRSGITIATGGAGLPPEFRAAGAGTVYWENKLGGVVGTTTAPSLFSQ